jgi:protein-disulfide isomerase
MYCAFEKEKFWEVHDLLMTNAGYDLLNNTVKNDKTKSAELAEFLAPVFDATQMKACLESGKYDNRISQDTQLASGIGISGTPGFYVNETNFAGAYSWKDMESAVNKAL